MDFQDYPEQPRTFSWKPVLIVGAGLLVAAGIIGGVLFFVRGGGKNALTSRNVSTSQIAKQNALTSNCDSMVNPKECRENEIAVTAASKKDVTLCNTLSSSVKDNCVWGVAVSVNDEKICKQISVSADANLCSDRIVQAKALTASDETICDKLVVDADKQNCHNAFLATVTVENCAAKKQDPAYCEFLHVTDLAVKAKNKDLCNVLKGFQVQVCRSHVIL